MELFCLGIVCDDSGAYSFRIEGPVMEIVKFEFLWFFMKFKLELDFE